MPNYTVIELEARLAAAKERAEKAEAQVQRVRNQWANCDCDRCKSNHTTVLRILDGDGDE
jgi:hypothetical protein